MAACWSFPDVAFGSYWTALGEVPSQQVSPEIRARTSEIAYLVTHFDQGNEQNNTDRGENEGQNISGGGLRRRAMG
jgi:hypothetical protein